MVAASRGQRTEYRPRQCSAYEVEINQPSGSASYPVEDAEAASGADPQPQSAGGGGKERERQRKPPPPRRPSTASAIVGTGSGGGGAGMGQPGGGAARAGVEGNDDTMRLQPRPPRGKPAGGSQPGEETAAAEDARRMPPPPPKGECLRPQSPRRRRGADGGSERAEGGEGDESGDRQRAGTVTPQLFSHSEV